MVLIKRYGDEELTKFKKLTLHKYYNWYGVLYYRNYIGIERLHNKIWMSRNFWMTLGYITYKEQKKWFFFLVKYQRLNLIIDMINFSPCQNICSSYIYVIKVYQEQQRSWRSKCSMIWFWCRYIIFWLYQSYGREMKRRSISTSTFYLIRVNNIPTRDPLHLWPVALRKYICVSFSLFSVLRMTMRAHLNIYSEDSDKITIKYVDLMWNGLIIILLWLEERKFSINELAL